MNARTSGESAAEVLPAALVSWCEAALRDAAGGADPRLAAVRIPSRTGAVYRLSTVSATGERRNWYLKHFAAEDHDVLARRFADLARIAAALHEHPALTPYVIVAADAERRLLLTQEMPGQTMVTLHRGIKPLVGGGADRIAEAWRGVGTWLAALHHSAAATPSATRASEIAVFTADRLRAWADADRARTEQADAALDALARVAGHGEARGLALTPCHGDVSGNNIFVGNTVGLIDFDDVRTDAPALDVSQAVLELQNLCHAWSAVPLTQLRERAGAAFADGYGRDRPDGPAFWLLHLRNLAVFLLTLARRCHGFSVSRLTDELHYGRLLAELTRTVDAVRGSDGQRSFWAARPGTGRDAAARMAVR